MTKKKDKPKFELIRKHLSEELKIFKNQELRMTTEIEEGKKSLKGAEEGLSTMRKLIAQLEQFLKTEGMKDKDGE